MLLLLGSIFVINGWVLYDTADLLDQSPLARRSYAAHLDVMPVEVWAVLFILVGATSAVAGFVGKLPAWIGFAGLQALSSFWGLLFVASYFQSEYGRAWLGAIQWAMVTGVLAIIADWEDPPVHPDAIVQILNGGSHD